MFPSVLNTFARPTASDRLNNPSHSALHNTVSSALGQVEAVIGVTGANSVVGTMMYDIHSPDSNGGGHVQTANKGGTGQTNYTKGDILVAQSTSVLTKLAVGANDTVLVADSGVATGVKWGAVPAIIVSSTIAVSSVWTKPAAATATSRVFVELWGGGGSGGAAAGTSEAGGGGGGGYVSGWYSASILTSVIINVGRGGESRLANGGGQAGTITVFDPISSLLTAYGGGGGSTGTSNAGGGGGAGTFSNGGNGSGANPGGGGSVLGGSMNTSGVPIINFGIAAASIYGGIAQQGGGGGGGIETTTVASLLGGQAIYGGGGGGGIYSSVTSGSVRGGLSAFGGAGGNSSILTVGSAMAGVIPGGGGAAGYGTVNVISGGEGAAGMAKITVFL